MDGLLNTEWAALKKIVNLLEPFASYTQLVSAGKNCYVFGNSTIYRGASTSFRKGNKFSYLCKFTSCVVFKNFLLQFFEENPSFAGVCDAMKNDLNHRFDFMIDETMDNFDCLYLLGTELDPNYRLFVSGEPAVQNIVTRLINKTAEDMVLGLISFLIRSHRLTIFFLVKYRVLRQVITRITRKYKRKREKGELMLQGI